jgi:hypothetical protein
MYLCNNLTQLRMGEDLDVELYLKKIKIILGQLVAIVSQ